MNTKKKLIKKTFTLVELIIVIAIIAILAVTAFLLLTQRLSKARDSRRVADISTISKSLNIYYAEKSKYPKPSDNVISITTSGSTNIIGYQGNLGEGNKTDLGINGEVKDPNTNELYTYRVNDSLTNYAILGYTENEMSYQDNQINATDFSKMYPRIDGEAGIIIDNNKTPVQNVATVVASGYIDIFNTTDKYKVYINNKEYLEGTGISLQGIQQFGDNGYGAPKSCPDGFIPVPGNKEFKQAGFCVAKYEMKQINGDGGYYSQSDNKRHSGANTICYDTSPCKNGTGYSTLLDGKIVSKPEGTPITRLNQATAIRACTQLGAGYHLITNNEWMAIARNIEQQPENWSGGVVGKNYVFNGNATAPSGWRTYPADSNDSNGCSNGLGGIIGGCNTSINTANKRTLKLSNGQIIRDLAANNWEFVNKANTINGSGYNNGLNSQFISVLPSEASISGWNDSSLTNLLSNYGPKINGLYRVNGVGNIRHPVLTTSNMISRGGGRDGGGSGIYAISFNLDDSVAHFLAGFRCAK